MKNKIPTLTIGIPAYNEEKNIRKIIDSIVCQKLKSVKIVRIIVLCDGCTDNTVKILRNLKMKYRLSVIHRPGRSGKANALNQIYSMSNSDFLLTTDADIVFSNSNDLEMLAKSIVKDSNLSMVGPLHVPTKSNTLFGNFSRYSALSFLDSVAKYNNGNNFYSCMSMEFMRKRFYKSFQFPEGTIADQCYAYWKSVENNPEGFKLVKNARVIFGVAQTFHDWRVLSTRSTIGDKLDTLKHFGNKILPLYTIPKNLLILSLIKWFFNNPLFLTGSVVMNIIIRMFPYNHKPTNGVWEMVNSSKELTI